MLGGAGRPVGQQQIPAYFTGFWSAPSTNSNTSNPNAGRNFIGADTWNYGGLEVRTPEKALADGKITVSYTHLTLPTKA